MRALAAALVALAPAIAAAQVLLSEVEVDPPSGDEPWEYVELRGPAGTGLAGTCFVVFDGDGGGQGVVDLVIDLGAACGGACALGTNGLLVVKSTVGGHAVPAETTVVTDAQLDMLGGGLENGTTSITLIASPFLFPEGMDFDANDDGVLEMPPGAVLLDAVGWRDANVSDLVYGGVVLTQGGSTAPGAATRFPSDHAPLSAAAWYNGELTGDSDSTSYDPTAASANFPLGGALTPGDQNAPLSTSTSTIVPTASTTTTLAVTRVLIPVQTAVVRPSRIFRFGARGNFPLPDRATDDPRSEGGVLSFAGAGGGAAYTLPSTGWRGFGPGKDGSKGFRFAGRPCRTVIVKPNLLKGICKGDTGSAGLPESGPVAIVLGIGDGTFYCGACGGVAKGNPDVLFKRRSCSAPPACL